MQRLDRLLQPVSRFAEISTRRLKQLVVSGAIFTVFCFVLLFLACICHEDLTCYDAKGNVVYKDQQTLMPFQASKQGNLERYCADHGYNSASLVHTEIFGLHKIRYFYGWHAMSE